MHGRAVPGREPRVRRGTRRSARDTGARSARTGASGEPDRRRGPVRRLGIRLGVGRWGDALVRGTRHRLPDSGGTGSHRSRPRPHRPHGRRPGDPPRSGGGLRGVRCRGVRSDRDRPGRRRHGGDRGQVAGARSCPARGPRLGIGASRRSRGRCVGRGDRSATSTPTAEVWTERSTCRGPPRQHPSATPRSG